MRVVNRVIAAVLALALLVGGLLVAVEIVVAGFDRRPWVLPHDRWYASARLRTSAGLVSLRMSVGIHSGSFDFFLVGKSHRELVIAGPEASRTVAMEQIAGAGEIAISPETATLLPTGVVGRPKDEAFLRDAIRCCRFA